MMARDIEPQLHGARGADEVIEAGRLRLPAEPADPPVLLAAHAAGDLGPVGVLDTRRGLQHLVGDRVDQPGAEQGGRVALRAEQGEFADLLLISCRSSLELSRNILI